MANFYKTNVAIQIRVLVVGRNSVIKQLKFLPVFVYWDTWTKVLYARQLIFLLQKP